MADRRAASREAWGDGTLLERGRELAVIEEAVTGTIAGAGRLILIEGEPGIGSALEG